MKQYDGILERYLTHGSETDLELAYECGRRALEQGFSLLEVIDIHADSVKRLMTEVSAETETRQSRAAALLKETLAPFEMARMGYRDTISLLREQNEKLRALMEERSQLLQQREDFMMVVTHDLKTPVTAADKCLTFLLDGDFGPLSAEQVEVISAMKDSNRIMFTMIKNLLEAYRFDQTTPALRTEFIDVRNLAEVVIKEFSFSARMRDIQLFLSLPEESINQVQGDGTSLKHVLTNLLDNALKFTPANGNITLAVRNKDDSHVQIEVKDTGAGMTKDELDNLFKRFFQADSGRKKKTGMGLGLYLCNQIVKAQGWEIECSSEPGMGTSFLLTLRTRSPETHKSDEELSDSDYKCTST